MPVKKNCIRHYQEKNMNNSKALPKEGDANG
jgi:hypothetical protein